MFKTLEEKWQNNASNFYRKYSTKQLPDGGTGAQPYLEFKPDDPDRNETRHDTRWLPIGSTKRDLIRIDKFLLSPDGLTFFAKQSALQAMNTYSETRILNPLFITANLTPLIHVRRPLSVPSNFDVTGDQSRGSSIIKDPAIGGAGRLQKTTFKTSIGKMTGGSFSSTDILSILPQSKLVGAVKNLFSLGDIGTIGVSERPELSVNGTYFSVLMWQGYQKSYNTSSKSVLDRAAANLRTGNINQAVKTIKKGAQDLLNQFKKKVQNTARSAGIPVNSLDGRSDIGGAEWQLDGRRYFITGKNSADRYFQESVSMDTMTIAGQIYDRPVVNMPALNNRTYITDTSRSLPRTQIEIRKFSFIKTAEGMFGVPKINNLNTKVNELKKTANSLLGKQDKINIKNFFSPINNIIKNIAKEKDRAVKKIKIANDVIKKVTKNVADISKPLHLEFKTKNDPFNLAGLLNSLKDAANPDQTNSAEESMLFPERSLRQRYLNDDRLADMRNSIDAQKEKGLNFWNDFADAYPFANFTNGLKGGYWQGGHEVEHGLPAAFGKRSGRYLSDEMNFYTTIDQSKTEDSELTSIGNIAKDFIHSVGPDFVDVMFFDFVNSMVLPFRSYITNIQESVSPVWNETRYVGRPDRHITYGGVTSDLSFTLKIHAFSDKELEFVWEKANYLKGMCYPSMYDKSGFMVPPLMKLTIGDMYRDHPCFIKSLTIAVEDGISWEIRNDEYTQVPHGLTMNISIGLLEKSRVNLKDMYQSMSDKTTASDVSVFYPVRIHGASARSTTGTNVSAQQINDPQPQTPAEKPASTLDLGNTRFNLQAKWGGK